MALVPLFARTRPIIGWLIVWPWRVSGLLGRTIVVLAAAALGLLALAAPAAAHEVGGVGATNFHTSLSPLRPATAGLSLTVVENGSRLQLVNTTGAEVVVRGYAGEPYARIGPAGVWVNDNSPATYLNADRYGTTRVPAGTDPAAPPRWRQISDEQVHRWHDHRIHWMLSTLPLPVAQAPDRSHRLADWRVDLDYQGQVLSATGSLEWVPGPSPVPWFAATALLAIAVVAAVFTRRAHRLLAAATGLLIAADIAHAGGIALVTAGNTAERVGAFLGGDLTALLIWPFALAAAVLLARGSSFTGFVAMGTGGLLASMMALDDAPVWWRSSAPSALPQAANQATVMLVVGLGAGLLIAGPLLWRRFKPPVPPTAPAGANIGVAPSTADDAVAAEASAADDRAPAVASDPPPEDPAVLDRDEGAPAGAPRRAVAGYLAAAGAGVIVGGTAGLTAADASISNAVNPTDASAALSDVGAAQFSFYGPRQAGIVTPALAQAHASILAFDLAPGVDAAGLRLLLKRWSEAAAAMCDGRPLGQPDDHLVTGSGTAALTVTFGFGPTLFGKAGLPASARPTQLTPLPAFGGEQLDPARSDGDLGVIVAGDDPLAVARAARVLTRLAAPAAAPRWQLRGFTGTPGVRAEGATGRNLMGQLDGTNNPKPTDPGFDNKIFVTDPAAAPWLRDGSLLVIRRIIMLLDDWDTLSLAEQQAVMGRRKDTGAALSGGDEHTPANFGTLGPDGTPLIAANAHIRLAAPAFNRGAAMLRRGHNFHDGTTSGLIFMAYQTDPATGFIPVHRRLAESDALSRFIRHDTSALFAIPHGATPGTYVGQDLFDGITA